MKYRGWDIKRSVDRLGRPGWKAVNEAEGVQVIVSDTEAGSRERAKETLLEEIDSGNI